MTLTNFESMWLFFTKYGYPNQKMSDWFPKMTIKQYRELLKKEQENL